VAEATAAVAAAEAAASAASIALSYTTIAAPFDGVVSARTAEPGAMAAPGAPLLTLEDTSAHRLEARLDEARAGQVAVGQAAQIRLGDASADQWKDGRVVEISRIDPASHGFIVKVDVPDSSKHKTGGFGRVRFAGESRPALTIPASALLHRGQLTFVFAVDGGRAARLRPVSVGQATGDLVEILAGVKEGDEIVVKPPAALADGTRISRATTPADAPGARP
jgi:RND family efflux transporter MFP subunit